MSGMHHEDAKIYKKERSLIVSPNCSPSVVFSLKATKKPLKLSIDNSRAFFYYLVILFNIIQ